MQAGISIDRKKIEEFCKRYRVRKLSLFGSVLREDFRPASDVDVLVEFAPGASAGFLRLAAMERTPPALSRYFRDEVVRTAQVQYAQG